MKTVGLVLLLLIPLVLAQVAIPQSREIPAPPTPSFGDAQTTSSEPQTTTSPSTSSAQSGGNNRRSSIPQISPPASDSEVSAVINTAALTNVQIPEIQSPQQMISNDDLLSRISALENEVAIVNSDLSALKVSQGQSANEETSYWQIVAIAGILVVISLVIKEGMILLKRKRARESEVDSYVRQARKFGIPDEEIFRRLVSAGWNEASIRQSFGR